MSTESMSMDQAVEALVGGEPAQEDSSLESVADSLVETAEEEEVEEVTEEVDSEVDYSEEDSEEYDTDEESADDTDDEPDHSEPETITVKVDGEEVSVTLEDLKRSYSGQGKIQKGMQEAAESRKQAEQMKQQAEQMMTQLSAMYQKAQQGGFKAPPQEPSRELFDSDPIGYMEAKMQYDEDVKRYNAERQEMTQIAQYQQAQMQQSQQQVLEREMMLMREKIPDLADPEMAGKFRENIVRTAGEYGYSAEDLKGVTDHRVLLVLQDAMRYRRSLKNKSIADQKAKKARPVIKPQAKKTQDPKGKQARQAKSKLKKTGTIDDALSLIMNS
jgi:uncharacterized phage infection (PIP) family protein YhgE